ncbi:MAG: phage holin family protein [Lachnospiraceae bacterium]|nr:phage holin family protein [Lachnospiraceae bacterium]
MNLNTFKMMLLTIFGTVGSFIINVLLGGWTEDLATLLIFMGIDFVMGLLIAAVWKKSGKSETGSLNSISAWKGLIRKGCSLLVVMVAYRLDVTLGVTYIKTAVIIAFIANEGISIVENYGIMGGPMPKVLKRAFEILQERADNAGEEKEKNLNDWN